MTFKKGDKVKYVGPRRNLHEVIFTYDRAGPHIGASFMREIDPDRAPGRGYYFWDADIKHVSRPKSGFGIFLEKHGL